MMLPITLDPGGRPILFVGGGKAAAAKIAVLAGLVAAQKGSLRIRIIAPRLEPALEGLVRTPPPGLEFEWIARVFVEDDLASEPPALLYSFTGQRETDNFVASKAHALRIPVNSPEAAGYLRFSSPAASVLRTAGSESEFIVAVSSLAGPNRTRGASPAASRKLLQKIKLALGEAPTSTINIKNAGPASATEHPQPPYMPFMIGVRRALVFAGERGEGLQKAEKLALYAGEVIVVCEAHPASLAADAAGGRLQQNADGSPCLVFGPGPVQFVQESLAFAAPVRVAILPKQAAHYTKWRGRLARLLQNFDYVCSDLADGEANKRLHQVASRLHIRHTVIDTKPLSDTWFTSIIDAGSIVAGISSRGGAAFYSKKLREELTPAFFARAPLGQILNTVRQESPVHARRQVLEAVWEDAEFRALAADGAFDAALVRARQVAAGGGENSAIVLDS